MPSYGQLTFLLFDVSDIERIYIVSMPSYGQLTFLLYPLKRPYFIRISDSDFAGNSQKILKTRLFIRFTCMFTVCSYLRFLLEPHPDYIAELNYIIFLTKASIQILRCVSNFTASHKQNNFVNYPRLSFRREIFTSLLIHTSYLFLANFQFCVLFILLYQLYQVNCIK